MIIVIPDYVLEQCEHTCTHGSYFTCWLDKASRAQLKVSYCIFTCVHWNLSCAHVTLITCAVLTWMFSKCVLSACPNFCCRYLHHKRNEWSFVFVKVSCETFLKYEDDSCVVGPPYPSQPLKPGPRPPELWFPGGTTYIGPDRRSPWHLQEHMLPLHTVSASLWWSLPSPRGNAPGSPDNVARSEIREAWKIGRVRQLIPPGMVDHRGGIPVNIEEICFFFPIGTFTPLARAFLWAFDFLEMLQYLYLFCCSCSQCCYCGKHIKISTV